MRTLEVSQPLTAVVLAVVVTFGAFALLPFSATEAKECRPGQNGTECNRYPTFGCAKGEYFVPATKAPDTPGHCCKFGDPTCKTYAPGYDEYSSYPEVECPELQCLKCVLEKEKGKCIECGAIPNCEPAITNKSNIDPNLPLPGKLKGHSRRGQSFQSCGQGMTLGNDGQCYPIVH